MNRSSQFVFLGITSLCLTTLLAQHLHLERLRQSIQDTSQEITQLDSRIKLRQSNNLPSRSAQITETTPRSTPSKTRLQEASIQLDQFIQEKGSQITNPTIMFSSLKVLLSIIKDLDSSELLQLEEKLSSKISQIESPKMGEFLQMIFLGIAGEDNPLAILDSERELDSEQLRFLFSSLVRKDSKEARRWLNQTLKYNPDKIGTSGSVQQSLPFIYSTLLFNQNFEAGLEAAEDYGISISPWILSDETKQKLRNAHSDPNYSEQKEQLSTILLQSALAHSPSQAIEEARQLNLSHQELIPVFNQPMGGILTPKQNGEFLDWMITSANSANDQNSILTPVFNAIQQWTNNDYQTSAEWLTNQSPSPIRDIAIEGFTYSIHILDPESATLWAAQIQNSEKRSATLKRSLKTWHIEDPEAAAAWEQANPTELE